MCGRNALYLVVQMSLAGGDRAVADDKGYT
jgi:hypothetical protein